VNFLNTDLLGVMQGQKNKGKSKAMGVLKKQMAERIKAEKQQNRAY